MDSPTLSNFPTELSPPDTFDFRGDAGEFTYQQEYSSWHRQTDDTLERMSLDRANAFRDVDLSQTGDSEHAMRLITNTAFMEFLTGSTMPAEEDNLFRHMARNSIASQVFGGKGADSEEALDEQITAHYQGRRDRRDLVADLRRTALMDGALPNGEEAGFNAWNEAAMTKPGYDKKRLADYREEFHELRLTSSRIVDRFRPDLKLLWDLNRMDGNVFLAAEEIFERLDPADREDFKRAFAIRAKALPKNEQASLVRNLTKTWNEMMFDQGKNTYVGAKLASLSITPTAIPYTGIQAPITDSQQWLELDAGRKKAKAEFLQKVNFAEELLRSSREDYNPTLSADGSGKPPGFWEDALYKTPGTVSTAFTMFVPVAGPTSMAFAMNGMAYQTFYDRFRETMDEATASEYASTLAPITTIPQMALERLGFNAVFRRVPGYSKLVGDLTAHFTNRFLQVGARTAAGLTAETGTELLEEVVSHSVQSLAHFTHEKIPATRWLGKEGAWASIAEQAPGIAVTLVPLAFFGGVRGAHHDARKKDLADARATAFSSASDSELEAFGGTAEAITGIQQAKEKGGAGLHEAIDRFMDTRDPDSESAKAAVVRLRASHEEQEQAGRILQGAGILPKAIQHPDGSFTLYDTTSGEEIAKAPDWESATRVATTHANMVEERDSDRIAALPEKFQSESGSGKNQSAAELSAEHVGRRISQVVQQSRAQEQLRGGSGGISHIVNGRNSKEQRRNIRKVVEQLGKGSDIPTTFREIFRSNRQRAHAAGLISLKDEVAFLRGYEKTPARGESQREETRSLLPDNFDTLSNKSQSAVVEKAVTGIAEAEILRSRGRTTDSAAPSHSPRGLSAAARVAPEAAIKTTSLINAVRGQWGLSLETAIELKNEGSPEEARNGGQDVKLDKLLGRDSRVPTLRLTPSSFKSAILKLIGKDQLRTVQPNVSYEDKVELLEVFAESIVPDGFYPDSPSKPNAIDQSIQHEHHTTESTPDPGHEGGIQIIEQRLANDLLIDTQVRFLGETIRTPEDLAVKAMALRNPHFETFYLFALKPLNRKSDTTADNQSSPGNMMVAGVMAITNRIPCSSAAFTSQNWDEGIDEQAAFLRGAEASDYLILHNHPSGDPTPSPEDLMLTKNLSIDLTEKGFRFHGHVVINHKTFARIDQNSEIHRGTIADGILPEHLEFDPYAWPIHSTSIGIEIQKVSQIAELASKLESDRIHPDNVIGFFTDAMLKTVAITVGTEQQFQSITREQLRDFGRSQGGVRLLLHAKASTEAQAIEIIERFERMNYFERLTQMVVEIPSPEGGTTIISAGHLKKFDATATFFGNRGTREKPKITQQEVVSDRIIEG